MVCIATELKAKHNMDYIIVEGKRRNSQNFVVDERFYTKKSEIRDGTNLRCVNWASQKCAGAAIICRNSKKVTILREHTCSKERLRLQEVLFYSSLKRTIKHNKVDLKEHYETVRKGFPDEVTQLSPFSKVRKNLEKIRATLPPPNGEEQEEKEGEQEESKEGKCPICQEEVNNIIMVMNCGHGVCPSCYKGLLSSKKTCHMCRMIIDEKKTIKHFKL